LFDPLLHGGRIVLAVTGAWGQAGKAQTMEQIIHSRQAVLGPEFLLENSPDVFGPQGADAIGLGGTGQEAFLEGLLLGHRQLAGATRLSFGGNRIKSPIAIGVHPQLHESSAAGQGACDLRSTVSLQGQHDGSIAVSLLGVALLAAALTQLFEILRMMGCDLHGTVPPISARVCHRQTDRATPFSQARKNIS
jgi:hypothetical protein